MNFGVGKVVEVGVVLAGKGFTESGGNDDTTGEVGITVDVETVPGRNRLGVQ